MADLDKYCDHVKNVVHAAFVDFAVVVAEYLSFAFAVFSLDFSLIQIHLELQFEFTLNI